MAGRQENLEREMTRLGEERARSRSDKAKGSRRESSRPGAQYLMRESVELMIEGLQAWIDRCSTNRPGRRPDAFDFITELPVDTLAFLATKAVLDSISRQQKLTAAGFQLGGYVEDEARLVRYIKTDKLRFEILKDRSKWDVHPKRSLKRRVFLSEKRQAQVWMPWSRQVRIKVGVTLLEVLAQCTGLITLVTRRRKDGKRQTSIEATDETLAWLERAEESHAAMTPFFLPCIAVPRDWTGPFDGGYHSQEVLQRPVIKTRNRAVLRELEQDPMPVVYDCLNGLQRTAWQINDDVSLVLSELWSAGSQAANLPSRDDLPHPEVPKDIETDEGSRRAWRKAKRSITEANVRARSMRVQISRISFMAERFKEIGRLWYPYSCDFRGRCYPIPYFLQPQGPDHARGLLRFADGEPLTEEGRYWLAVHGANTWGEDKITFDERVQWVADNHDKIMAVGEDPLANEWWQEADKPWQFLAFACEWWRVTDDPTATSHLPIHMDGSSNGLQIFSLLLKDPIGARATNCVPLGRPADVYQRVADALTLQLVKGQREDNDQERGWATKWLEFFGGKAPRSATKRPVMVLPYGGTLYSCQQYLIEWYDDQVRGGAEAIWPIDKFNPTMYLAKKLWSAIDTDLAAANNCMDWLQECATVCTKANRPIRWTSPSGFPVAQEYPQRAARTVTTAVGDSIRRLTYLDEQDRFDGRRQRNGISPNFVHSLDAACLHMTVARLRERGVRDFAMIHDSFAVQANHIPVMARTLREVYRDVFRTNQLEAFKREVEAYLPAGVHLPDPPAQGDLDIEELVKADYFFA